MIVITAWRSMVVCSRFRAKFSYRTTLTRCLLHKKC